MSLADIRPRTISPGEMARNSGSSSKISIWWDIENCHVPRNVDPHYIAQNLRSALHHANLNGPITIDIFGDTRNLEHRILEALSSTGVTINHIPSGNKDAADKAILVAMLFWALDNPPPAHFLLISGDGDFANALHRLRLKGYDILLARPDQPVKPALLGAATSVWYWTNVAKGHVTLAEEEKRGHEDSSGIQSRALRVSTEEDAQYVRHRATPLQETILGKLTSSTSSRTYDVKCETNKYSFGEQHMALCERDLSSTISTLSRASEDHVSRDENVKLFGDTHQLESNFHAQRTKLVSHNPTSTSVNASKQLHNPGQHSMQSGRVGTFDLKQSYEGHLSSNKITDFNTKGPPKASLPIPTGHLQGPPQDVQRADNMNLLKLMKTFERLKMDSLVPTQENLQNCLRFWDQQHANVNLKQVLDQAMEFGHVEKVPGDKGGDSFFLPSKTELWSCFDVGDMHYAFSDTLSKDFHQFLCCSKNWQFFVHSQSMYEVAQRLKKNGPTGMRALAVGEVMCFLKQAIWKWQWLSLENSPTFLLSIKSHAIFTQSPGEEHVCVPPPRSPQLEKAVLSNVERNHNDSRYDTSTRRMIVRRLRGWLKETANTSSDYDISLVPKDFQLATGIYLDIQKLGFSKLQELLEEFSDVVKIQAVRKGLKVLCPAQGKQQKGTLPMSQDMQQKGLLSSPQDNGSKPHVGLTGYAACIEDKQGCSKSSTALNSHGSIPSAILTSQHVGATQAFTEKPVGRNHPLMKKLRNWLLELPSLEHGYDLSLVKRDFSQATGMVLDSSLLFKVKDIVKMFPEDFHVECPRHGLALLYRNNNSMPATKSNAGDNRRNPGAESLERVVSDGALSKLPQVKANTGSAQWKELHSPAKASRTVEATKELVVASITSPRLVFTSSLPPHASLLPDSTELLTDKAKETNGLTN